MFGLLVGTFAYFVTNSWLGFLTIALIGGVFMLVNNKNK